MLGKNAYLLHSANRKNTHKTIAGYKTKCFDPSVQFDLYSWWQVNKNMSNSNVSAEEMPEWLTVDFFRNLLSITGDLSVTDVQFACAKGENFASVIFRVKLEFGSESRWVIVKSSPVGGFSEEFSKKFNIFPKEIEMYEIIDRFEKIYQAIGRDVTFAPK